jgi:hypothetical protein
MERAYSAKEHRGTLVQLDNLNQTPGNYLASEVDEFQRFFVSGCSDINFCVSDILGPSWDQNQ